ncbi:ABC transporter substrate-binding protein [Erysipelothrix anatis]|uniref:ABC transporter substrate-binding protein n=1 Tax=Erysipelothrix anatis TaxID=2683713 RepID=UPI0013574C77|nr:ABC transporter substrate-binding protein [Erysipelothrix anatis]
MKKISFMLVLLFVIVGCGRESQEMTTVHTSEIDTPVTIDFWSFWGSQARRPIIEEIIADFNESNESVQVKHTYNPYGDIWTKELAAISAGNPPDVVINDINATRIRGDKQRAEDLSEFFEDDFSGQYFPNLWDAVSNDNGIYGIPFNTDTRVLFYNKNHFKEVGLDPKKPPKTWNELTEYARMLDKKTDSTFNRLGFYPLYNVDAGLWLINANGENYVDDSGHPSVDSEINKDVFEWLLEWKNHYGTDTINRYQASVDNQQSHPFFTQELSMIVATGTFYNEFKQWGQDFDVGVAFIPEYEPGTGHTSWGGGFVAEIPYGAKNKEESWQFIKHLTGFDSQTKWGYLNFDNVAHIEASNAVPDNFVNNPVDAAIYEVLAANMTHTILTPTPSEIPNYADLANAVFEEIILERITIEEGLTKLQHELEQAYEAN